MFAEVGEAFDGKLDILVHSVAFAAAEDLEGRFTDTPRDRFWMAIDVSAYSLVACTRAAEPLFEAAGGGSVLTMTYLGGERAVPHYNVMGVAKATLDSSVKYLAWDLGSKNIRVNAISAGPVRTLAARSIAGFPTMESIVEERSPLHRHVDADDVGAAAAYLLSRRRPQRHRHDAVRRLAATTRWVCESGQRSRDASRPPDHESLYVNGLVTMSAITSSSTAMSTRAISRILLITAIVSGCSGPFSSARRLDLLRERRQHGDAGDERRGVADEAGVDPEGAPAPVGVDHHRDPHQEHDQAGRSEDLLARERGLAGDRHDLGGIAASLRPDGQDREERRRRRSRSTAKVTWIHLNREYQ